MLSQGYQLDLLRHSDAAMARAYRIAAETALRNPFETPEACERRAQAYLEAAARIEQGKRG